MSTVVIAAFALVLSQSPNDKSERQRHPLAPSLPILTEKEIAQYEAVVERFIQYDIGKLPKSQGEKAKAEFLRLPPEAFFVLVEAFNRAANMEHSCPAVVIGKKLASIIRSSDDFEMLQFAKDTIGLGVKARRHMGVVKDLQVTCILRKGFLQSQALAAKNAPRPNVTAPVPGAIPAMTQAEFLKAAQNEQGPRLKAILAEADRKKLFDVLIIAAARPETEAKEIGQSYLDKHLDQKTGAQLRDLLKHSQPAARAAAAKAIGQRKLPFAKELIDTLADDHALVRQAARRALVQWSDGRDFGPEADADEAAQSVAIRRWRDWLGKMAK